MFYGSTTIYAFTTLQRRDHRAKSIQVLQGLKKIQ